MGAGRQGRGDQVRRRRDGGGCGEGLAVGRATRALDERRAHRMKKVALVTAAVMVAVIFFVLATLPPKPIAVTSTVDPDVQRRTIAGAYHIHSTRSDGASDKDTIAAAASRAGL